MTCYPVNPSIFLIPLQDVFPASAATSQSDRDFSWLSFPNGIKSYKMLHVNEMSGLLLLLTICLHCHLGGDNNHIGEIMNNSFVCYKPAAPRARAYAVFRLCKLLQMLLCMEAWIK
jgi:hypothetical protein